MNPLWDTLGFWPVRVLVAGGTVLLMGRLLLLFSRQPARRVWIGTAAIVAALLAIPLSLVPAWVHVAVPTPQVVVEVQSASRIESALARSSNMSDGIDGGSAVALAPASGSGR